MSAAKAQVRGRFVAWLAAFMLLLCMVPVAAEAAWPQGQRFSTNANGDLVLIGNMLVHCSGTGATCTNAQNGVGNLDNYNSFTSTAAFALVDVDGDGTTTNSSSSNINMPAGSTVVWAGLYWGSRYSTSTGAPALTAANSRLKFRTPGGSYQLLAPDQVETNGAAPATSGSTFQAFKDVTSLVQAGGNGTYWGADIFTAVARNAWAGWALVVVYENPALPFRNFAVYDGFAWVNNGTVTSTPTGFLTPFNGPVVARLGVVLWDGDRQAAGTESLLLNGNSITNAVNPSGDVWNSTISDIGNNVATRSPNYLNTLGVDIDRFNIPSGWIANGATSATIGVRSPGTDEVFWFGVTTFMTDIYVPVVIPNVVKTAQDMSPSTPLLRGDTLRWNVVLSNTGFDSATSLVAVDNIPAYLTYKPGSLVIDTGAGAGSKTDSQYDDQADFQTGPDRVTFRLGTGANATQGGTLAYGQATSFHFDTIVNADAPAGLALSNQVQIQYNSQTLPATTFAASSAAATATVLGPPSITKSFTPAVIEPGQAAVMTITLSNAASNPEALTGVSFTDTYPANMANTGSANPLVNCTPGSTAGTLTGGANNGNSIGMSPGATIAPNGSCIITVNVTSAAVGTYLNATSAVTSGNGGTGNTASATLYVGKPKISKVFAPTTINAGGVSTITFTLQNLSALPLTQVAFSDALVSMQVAAVPTVVNSCGGTVSAVAAGSSIALANGLLPGNGSCTLSVNVTSAFGGAWPNTTTGVSSLQSGAAGQPSNTAVLTVIGPPTISKSFFPTSVRASSPSTLSIVVSNPNAVALTAVGFTDTYPVGSPSGSLVNSTPSNVQSSCTVGSSVGTLTANNGSGSLAMSGGSFAAGGSCTITVNVQSTSQATFNNVTGAVSGTVGAGTLTGGTATASLVVANRLTVAKAFTPTSIAYNDPVTPAYTAAQMTITVTATAGSTVTGVNVEDTFPTGMIVANTPATSITGTGCSAAALEGRTGLAAWGPVASGNTAIRVTGASIAGSGNCAVKVNVTSNSSGAYANSTDTVYSDNGGTAAPASATLNVLGPPAVSKSFNPVAIIPCTGTCNTGAQFSTLTLTLTNPSSLALAGVGVVDNFPSGLVVNGTPTVTNSCTGSTFRDQSNAAIGANDTGVILTGVTLAANATCSVSVRVRSGTAGDYVNTTEKVTSTNGGVGNAAQASLGVAVPTVAKSFNCTQPIVANTGTCTLQVDITAPTSSALSNARVIDIFPLETPSGGDFKLTSATLSVVNVGAGTCPTFTYRGRTGSSSYPDLTLPMASLAAPAVGNTAIVAESNAAIPAGVTCRISATVTSTVNATNFIPVGALTGTIGGNTVSNATAASAILQVYDTPSVQKAFADPSMLVNGTTEMTIEISHLNSAVATGLAFEDIFPGSVPAGGEMRLASPLTISNSCNGTLQSRNRTTGVWRAQTVGDNGLKLSGTATIPAISSCLITANVTATQAGSYTNTINTVTTTNFGSSGPVSANIVVLAPPTLAKAFTPNTIMVNETSLLTLTLTNPNGVSVTGAGVVDNYPVGLVNAATPNASSSCPGAVLTAAANGSSLSVSSATIPANGSCSVSVQVTSAAAAAYNNTTNALTTTNAGSGAVASATLTVSPYMPTLSVLKSVSVLSDPLNNASNPKAIPGSVSRYVVRITNSGPGIVDANTLFVRDVLPPEVEMYVGPGALPTTLLQGFAFTNGTPVSGLSCTFGARNNGGDCVDFSSDGVTFTYTPNPDADGFDSAIKAIQFRPAASFNAAGAGNPWAEFSFQVRLK